MALYRLICNADRTNLKIAVACGARGELWGTFPRDIQIFNYWHALSLAGWALKQNTPGLWLARSLFNATIRLIHKRFRPDVWYINTIGQPNLVALAREIGVPCIIHTHESESGLYLLKPHELEDMISYPKLIIAASECAAEVFRVLGRRENIQICSGAIDINEAKSEPKRAQTIRQSLDISPDAFVWAMAGSRDPNKNPIGFVRIANRLLKRASETYFLWVGGRDTSHSQYAKALARTLNIDHKIVWLPERTNDYFDYLNVADGFVLTSLNESLSIVTLEAAALGKPFVSFDSGGPKEIFRDGMGAIVDSWNVEDMVEAMIGVMNGDIYLNADVSRERAGEFDISTMVKQWESIMRTYIKDTQVQL